MNPSALASIASPDNQSLTDTAVSIGQPSGGSVTPNVRRQCEKS